MTPQDRQTVLVVDDDVQLADLYTAWLADEYVVKTAYSGPEALDVLDETVDVILLDRRMPELAGETVLDEIRDRDLDSRVALVTAVAPDFDILELGFDEYLVKPVSKADLDEVVELLLQRQEYGTAIQRYYQLVAKRAALIAEKGSDGTSHPKYDALQADIDALQDNLEKLSRKLDDADYEAQFHRLE